MTRHRDFGFVSESERRAADAFFADLMGWSRPSYAQPTYARARESWGEDGQEDTSTASAPLIPTTRRWNDANLSQKRKKVLAIIGNLFPMLWQAVDAPRAGVAPQNGGGQYNSMGPWGGPGTSCTSANTMVGGYASPSTKFKWAFKAYEHPAWVPWGHPTKKLPNVGDVYLLYRDNPEQGMRHCGIVLQVPTRPGELWVMGDGGQKAHGKEAAHVLVRSWELRRAGPSDPQRQSEWQKLVDAHSFAKPTEGLDYPYLAGGVESRNPADANRLIGWLDIDELPFPNPEFDPPQPSKRRGVKFTQADYESLGAIIDSVYQFNTRS
jgi:hypothetical protein